MGLKDLMQRLFPRPYLVLDKRGVKNILSQIDFFREEGYAFFSSFLNNDMGDQR